MFKMSVCYVGVMVVRAMCVWLMNGELKILSVSESAFQ